MANTQVTTPVSKDMVTDIIVYNRFSLENLFIYFYCFIKLSTFRSSEATNF